MPADRADFPKECGIRAPQSPQAEVNPLQAPLGVAEIGFS